MSTNTGKRAGAYSVPQNSFPLPIGSIFSFATLGSALGKDYAAAIVTLFYGTLWTLEFPVLCHGSTRGRADFRMMKGRHADYLHLSMETVVG